MFEITLIFVVEDFHLISTKAGIPLEKAFSAMLETLNHRRRYVITMQDIEIQLDDVTIDSIHCNMGLPIHHFEGSRTSLSFQLNLAIDLFLFAFPTG